MLLIRLIEDGQRMGEALLYAEVRLGELLKAIEPKYAMGSVEGTNRPHREKTLPEGITRKQSYFAQTLADHQEVIKRVIQESRDNNAILFLWVMIFIISFT